MKYNIGNFYLIKKNYKDLNLNGFIGEILQKNENELYTLKIYIFPESTTIGRQSYMGKNEIYSTDKNILYQFTGQNEIKIEVIPLDRYINLKLKDQPLGNDIYFYRQSYSFETKKFNPQKLPKICFCKKIFNPDLTFKQCICGNFFHLDCFIKESTNECWVENCHYNCNNFLDLSQQIRKMMSKSDKNDDISNNNNNNNKTDNDKQQNKQNNNSNFFYQFEFKKNNSELLNKKTKRNSEDDIINISRDSTLNLSKKSTSSFTTQSKNDKIEQSLNLTRKSKSSIIIGSSNKIQENINREKGLSLIYKVLKEGLELIQNNFDLRNQYEQNNNRNKITNTNLSNFSEQIEKNLFLLYKSNSSLYKNFLLEFNKIKKNSQDLLFKIIFGHYTPEQISNFKGDDFLSEEKKKEKEIQKLAQMESMKFKNESNNIKMTMSKGNLLTEKEVFIESNNHENENINLNLKMINSDDKILEKQKQFPDLKISDIKNLISMETPGQQYIKQRLRQMLKQNLDINSLNYFKEKRRNMLIRKAKTLANQEMKKINGNDNDKENIRNYPEYESKVNDYLEKISFSNLLY